MDYVSDRLVLRPVHESDAAFVESLYADDRITRTLLRIQAPITMDEARELCRPSTDDDFLFVAVIRGEGSRVGLGSVRKAPDVSVGVIGYSILPAFWGQGYATELACLLVRFATEAIAVIEVRATTLDDNPASGRVLEKAGFRLLAAGQTELDSLGHERAVSRWFKRAQADPTRTAH